MKHVPKIAAFVTLALAVVLTAVIANTASSQSPDEVDVGARTCTTTSGGYCVVPHNLGVAPTHVGVTLQSPAGFVTVDRRTISSFRMRVLATNGTAYVGAVTFTYAAFQASASPTPTPTPTSPTPTTTPTPTPTPTPTTPTPTPTPPPTGFPDASTTGVQPGHTLTPSGCITASTNQVIEDRSFVDCDINVPQGVTGVVIRNVRFTFTSPTGVSTPIIVRSGGSATISYADIAGRDTTTGSTQFAIRGLDTAQVTIRNVDMSNCSDCVQGEHVKMYDSYIHDLANPAGAHVDGFQCNGDCSGTVIDHNTINMTGLPQTGNVALFSDFGTPHDATVNNNLLLGGGYNIYSGAGPNIHITNNRMARAQYGYVASYQAGNGNTCTGNVDHLTGVAINC
ncbi:hypothetical protein SAMN05421678_112109 [Actinopolymorpha cephalotaxi]|uniref:Right handed beta helix region n=1 Tax=Actinopolymorpha cephalotaxi TaxID=504797 RepID=A0A1I2XCE4_9ACTN|nr:hypothetical protein [Actinopolymorpha cephalotaxi]NYH86174.1 hypothetical protein [Actinopolymorpha cephalotaxi]SFH11062.1 hypothetical protein SAMN05421678_112109 [Actinopolymorpha cephalotaxi]